MKRTAPLLLGLAATFAYMTSTFSTSCTSSGLEGITSLVLSTTSLTLTAMSIWKAPRMRAAARTAA